MHTKDLVEAEGFSVIYGDTDSIMINTNSMNFKNAKLVGQNVSFFLKNYNFENFLD